MKLNVFSVVVELIWPLLIESIRFATLALILIGCGKDSANNVNTKGDSKESLSEEVNKEDNSKDKNDIAFKENETGQRIEEQEFNNKKARVTYFVQKSHGTDISTYQVTFLNNGKSYIFTISAVKKISDENMKSFEDMLNTVEFQQ